MIKQRPKAVIFDLDGTLSDITHRLHFIKDKGTEDWKSFNGACYDDKPKEWAKIVFGLFLKDETFDILIVTGRDESMKYDTISWLQNNDFQYNKLYMRKYGDYRDDAIVKKEIYENEIVNEYDVAMIFDDRDKVVDMWRGLGLTCLQCQYGGY